MPSLEHLILEKYKDKVDPRHRMAMDAIGMAYQLLSMHKPAYEELLKSKQFMDSVGGMLDPTLYRDMLYSKSLKQQLKLTDAALAFLRVADEIRKEIESDDGPK